MDLYFTDAETKKVLVDLQQDAVYDDLVTEDVQPVLEPVAPAPVPNRTDSFSQRRYLLLHSISTCLYPSGIMWYNWLYPGLSCWLLRGEELLPTLSRSQEDSKPRLKTRLEGENKCFIINSRLSL